MKALILAAGRGTRMQSANAGEATPKCLIPVDDNVTILDRQIDSLFALGASRIGIVIGHEMDRVFEHVRARYRDRIGKFQFIVNPRYAETGSLYSLWLAREWTGNDSFVCLNGDVAFDARILSAALRSQAPVSLVIDPAWRDKSPKVIVSNGRITRISKTIPWLEFSGSYCGIALVSAEANARVFQQADEMIRAGRIHDPATAVVQRLADESQFIGYSGAAGFPWVDIDDTADLAYAKLYVFPRLMRPAAAASVPEGSLGPLGWNPDLATGW
jgi:choline kinase